MTDKESWDWQVGKKAIADLQRVRGELSTLEELAVSPDGQKIAVLGKTAVGSFAISVNGEVLPESYELAWHLRFSPIGRLIALVRIDDEWTLAVDGAPWENRFEYAWNPIFSDCRTVTSKLAMNFCRRRSRTQSALAFTP